MQVTTSCVYGVSHADITERIQAGKGWTGVLGRAGQSGMG